VLGPRNAFVTGLTLGDLEGIFCPELAEVRGIGIGFPFGIPIALTLVERGEGATRRPAVWFDARRAVSIGR
jgi:hypothetical protein